MSGHMKAFRPSGELDDSLYHLLKRAARLAADIHLSRSGGSGLTQRQFAVLFCLSQNDGASQTLLVRRTGIDRSTLADLAARMEARGLIRRENSERDRRARELHLTPKGRRALRAMEPLMADVDQIIFGLLSPERAEAFRQTLKFLTSPEAAARLEEMGVVSSPRSGGGSRREAARTSGGAERRGGGKVFMNAASGH